MSELATERCQVCKPGTPPLSEAEVAELSELIADWSRVANKSVSREFSFKNFRDSFGFVARVSLLAESEGHHPDVEFGWGHALITFTTHAAAGLTRNDFVMAAKVDQMAQS
jgi:4a-hydroxytetrahydrobiopterin dehydratase